MSQDLRSRTRDAFSADTLDVPSDVVRHRAVRRRRGRRAAVLASLLVVMLAATTFASDPAVRPSSAVAGWSPTPQPADPERLAWIEQHCTEQLESILLESSDPADPFRVPPPPTWESTSVDIRGNLGFVVYEYEAKGQRWFTDCAVLWDPDTGELLPDGTVGFGPEEPLLEEHAPLSGTGGWSHTDSEGGGITFDFGRTSPEIARVTVTLDDGRLVEAHVANGWWTAWWPDATEADRAEAFDADDRLLGWLVKHPLFTERPWRLRLP